MATVSDVMSTTLLTVEPTIDARPRRREQMNDRGVGAVLVLHERARVSGILTERDVLRAVATGEVEGTHVAAWMTRDPETSAPDDSTGQAAAVMIHGGFRHLPVVDARRPVGIVSIRDLMRSSIDDEPEAALMRVRRRRRRTDAAPDVRRRRVGRRRVGRDVRRRVARDRREDRRGPEGRPRGRAARDRRGEPRRRRLGAPEPRSSAPPRCTASPTRSRSGATTLARTLTLDQGKPLAESRDEVEELVQYWRNAAEDGKRLEGRLAELDLGRASASCSCAVRAASSA